MTNRKQLMMFVVTGLALPVGMEGVASAGFGTPKVTRAVVPSTNDLAPVTGTPARLRRTDEEQAGNEMAHLAFFGTGTATDPHTSGLLVAMTSSDLCNGTVCVSPTDRVQLSVVPFHLAQNADGSVSAVTDMAGAKFATTNRGNEYRNANHPIAYAIAGGTAICAEYNYQPNNDTKRYMQCWNKAGATIMPQTQIYAKNNDDCSMNQDSNSTTVVSTDGLITKMVAWRGCNGNGNDDGWATAFAVTVDSATAPTRATFAQQFDVSLCPREERSRGFCSVAASDPNTAICSWTEGNNQPQRDGTWLAAINIGPGVTGNNRQNSILWKQQIDGRKGTGDLRTYSARAKHERIMAPNATTGILEPSDLIIWQSGDLHGNNNNNNGKGGTYYAQQMAVMKVSKDGMTYVAPLQDMQPKLLGQDGTHLGMGPALYGTTDKMMPGVMFVGGSQTGGGYAAKVRAVGFDTTTNAFADLGSYSIAPYDRHLYPNYLGNNPGNQGRNFSGAEMIPNPFVGQAGNTDAYLMVISTTGKDPTEVTQPELKLGSYITVLPIVQKASGAGTGGGTGGGSGSGSGSGDPTTDPTTTDPGTNLGGCSTTGGTGGALGFLLIGLVGLIRRRR